MIGVDVTAFFFLEDFRYSKEYSAFFDIAKLVVDGRAKHSHRGRQTHVGVYERRYIVAVFAYGLVEYLVVILECGACEDPGHGGNDSGAIGINNVYEKNLTLKIAQYCKQELEKYNCKVVMTRTGDTNPSLEERADYAKAQGAKYLISIHLNSAAGGGAVGAEVYYPNTHWRPDISADGKNVAQAIQSQLVSLGLYDRGIKFRTIDTNIYPDPFRYNDGSVADYYGIIRNAKYNGLTGLIIEHCFINNVSDYNNYLSTDTKLQQLGVADANGIVSALGLSKGAYDSTAGTKKSILYQTHVQDYGWQTWKKNGEMAGTQGAARGDCEVEKNFIDTR